MSYIGITLDTKIGDHSTSGHYEIKLTSQPYNTNYLKVTHNIKYEKGYSYWSANYFYLKFRKNSDKIYFYYYHVNKSDQIVRSLEVYLSHLHPRIPLIIGFKTNDNKRYFTYTELNSIGKSYGFPSGGFDERELEEKLKSENKRRNKLNFNIKPGQHQHYEITEDVSSYEGFTKSSHSAEDDLLYDNHSMSKQKLFEKETLHDSSTIDKLLKDLDGQAFDFINVYYSTEFKVILLLEFIADSTKTHFIRKDKRGGYWVKEIVNYADNNRLKLELNKIKSILGNLLFMLDKNSDYIKFENRIKVTNDQQRSLGFTKYIHTPTEPQKANVFYNDISFSITENNLIHDRLEAQDKSYEKIETYSLNTRATLHLLIKFKLLNGSKEYYFQRSNKEGTQWKQIDNGYLSSNQHIKNKLLEIDYPFQKSLVLKINETGWYNSGIVNNSSNSPPTTNTFTVSPKSCSSCGMFRCYNHDLSRYKNNHNVDVVGIRLYCNNNEIKLYYGALKEENRKYIYYDKTRKDFYVYFYNRDNRPLMFCYNNKAYRATSKENFDNFKFSLENNIKTCPCLGNDQNFTTNLNDINDLLNEVNLFKHTDYVVHSYNNNDIKITVRNSTSGCYIRYKHTPSSGNVLGTIKYNDYYIKDSDTDNYIKASGNREISVYYNINDRSRKIPLLVALCNSTNCNNTNLYYELQKNDNGKNKIYKKFSHTITLDTSFNGSFHTKLDGLFYGFTKSLYIVLDKLPNNYQSKLSSNNQPSQESRTNITVENLSCTKLYHSSYKCYLHKITSISEIGEVGGIKFHLYDSKELNLYSDSNGLQKMSNIKYTSCKGNVLVFFYDSDPRPLLLCFDSRWYRPKDKNNYDKQWVRVTDLESCNCNETAFRQDTQLLKELYKMSMELNPVNLDETKNAFKVLGSQDFHSYNIHNYYPRPIKVKINSQNLVCYKKYVHQPESGYNSGYRLGKIYYEGRTNHGISYPEERHLQQVLLYYSVYDTEHKYPLLVKLCFKNSSSSDTEYYKLDDKNNLKWEKLSSDKYGYLLGKLSKDETFESGLYDIRTGMNIYYDEDQKKKYFFDPEKCKEDDVNVAAVVGGSVGGGVAGIGSFVGIGFLVFKKAVAALA